MLEEETKIKIIFPSSKEDEFISKFLASPNPPFISNLPALK
jgi:hypothetical protein